MMSLALSTRTIPRPARDITPAAETIRPTMMTVQETNPASPAAHADADKALIAECLAGEQEAFGQLFARHQERVYGLALRLAGDPADAADILQEVFLRVYRSLATFRQDAAFSTWLYRLTVNAARTYLGKRSKRRERELPLAPDDDIPVVTRHTDPLSRKHLLQALAQLPPKYREVLVLHDVEGLRHREIAEVLGVQVGTSKSQLHKARKHMRAALQEVVAR